MVSSYASNAVSGECSTRQPTLKLWKIKEFAANEL